jgi:hypothetical protein
VTSRAQRMKNRSTARKLRHDAHTCENCGERGAHWVNTGFTTLEDIMAGRAESRGFWVCPKLYGPDGRRIAP